MNTKFELITENPDTVWEGIPYNSKSFEYEDYEARPFFIEANENHTKVVRLYVGKRGTTHGDIKRGDSIDAMYPGRIWLENKIISFWVYPNVILFKDIIKSLEEELNIKIFNNGWRLEILKIENDKILRKEFSPNNGGYYLRDHNISAKPELISIEKYDGSEDVSEEEKIIHLMNWKEKEFAKQAGKIHFKGFGSDKTAWDQARNIKYRQAIYQENHINKFENFQLITEDPDTIYDDDKNKEYYCRSIESRPFFINVNSDHTKVTKIIIGDYGTYHSDIRYDMNYNYKRAYPGRVWLNSKIMSFWVYPNEILFKDIIKNLEEKLNIKMFNNGWRIEIIENENGKITKDIKPGDDYYYVSQSSTITNIISLDEYSGSEDVSEKDKIMHLMNWKEKELAKQFGKIHFKGFGSDKTAWDQPRNIRYRQAIYQEKFITSFEKYNLIKESPDEIYFKDDTIGWGDGKNKPFYIVPNDDHTKVKRLYVGGVGYAHCDMNEVDNRAYAGRVFLDLKVITFWTYPNQKLFKDIIKKLEIKLRRKIFNNKWKVEIIRKPDNSIKIHNYDPNSNNYYFSSRFSRKGIIFDFIPIEEYIDSEDIPEELKIQHLMNCKEKEEAKKQGLIGFRGVGSDKTAWDQPKNIKYRQTIYQENKRY